MYKNKNLFAITKPIGNNKEIIYFGLSKSVISSNHQNKHQAAFWLQ